MTKIITKVDNVEKYRDLLKGKKIAVIGYGNQGRSQALNMRDFGLDIVIGNPKDSYFETARKDGFRVMDIKDACNEADIIFILIPDEVQPQVFNEEIKPGLKAGDTLVMASGYNYFYGYLDPPDNVNVLMIAPRMIGWGIRDMYTKGIGFPVLIAVGHDYSGNSKEVLIGLSIAIGALMEGGCAIESSFREETLVDLLSEHSWAGAILFMFRAYYEVATELGASPEAVILELYASGELAEIAESMKNMGLFKQLKTHSRTSQYGQLTRGPKYIGEEIKNLIRKEAMDILNGKFATEWTNEQKSGMAMYKRLHEINAEHPMEKKEEELYRLLKRGDCK
ncbi:MAG: ketol-acid reductoisomerase [Candidatus Micrarchaeaceae archaeon]